jgi:hypothetical protein
MRETVVTAEFDDNFRTATKICLTTYQKLTQNTGLNTLHINRLRVVVVLVEGPGKLGRKK